MASEPDEDLASLRHRIRGNARRRREKRSLASRRRRSSGSGSDLSSSSSSRDLLRSSSSSSSSPSPPPPPVADGDPGGAAPLGRSAKGAAARAPSSNERSPSTAKSRGVVAERGPTAPDPCRPHDVSKRRSSGDSESDDEGDLADMCRRLAERQRAARFKVRENDPGDSSNALRNSSLWGDDDSEEEVSVRQMIARKAEKRKRESSEGLSSEKMSDNKRSSQAASSQEEDECTPKMCNKIIEGDASKASPPPLGKNNDHDPSSGKATTFNDLAQTPSTNAMHNAGETASNIYSAAPKQRSPLHQAYLKAEASSLSQDGVDGRNSTASSTRATLKSWLKSTDTGGNSRRNNTHNSKGGERTTRETSQSTVKGNASPSSMRPISASTKPSPAGSEAGPIVGREVRARSNVKWSAQKQCLLIRTVGSCATKSKVAGFDLDNTLVNWRCAGWPSRPEHYELWNGSVVEQLRQLHDDGHKLVIFSNQGGIRGAFHGKKSGTVKNVIDWIANLVDRPLYAVCSTKTNSGYHKGNPGMWEVMEDCCNCGKLVCPDSSFFVGDADGKGDTAADPRKLQHQQSGTDKLFAENVGKMRNTTMEFYSPGEYFGPSDVERRRSLTSTEAPPAPPDGAIRARAALLGGYLPGPILLVLVGVQGSGKSTFSRSLVDGSGGRWRQFSQDTIRNGRPGTRQAVEQAARESLRGGKSVVIDRMHLDAEQRRHFIQLANQCQVPVHGLLMVASKEEVEERVKRRVNHPGKVEGTNGARIAVASLSKLKFPTYDEGFTLISYSQQTEGTMLDAYQHVGCKNYDRARKKTMELHHAGTFKLPMITLGTMNMRKGETTAIISRAMQLGMESIDTAPTYNNESQVGAAMKNTKQVVVTIKVPKRCTTKEQTRKEVMNSLSLLQRSKAVIVLLHWPCDFIVADTLSSVWKELEAMQKEGLCSAIGVCNFTVGALKNLLRGCTVKPALNQVERHPLLPQYDLMEYCDSQGIVLQAHSPLGNGSQLLLENDAIIRVAEESRMSPAQVLLCWNLQHGVPVVTKFSSKKHGEETSALLQRKSKLYALSPQQMKMIDNICSPGKSRRFVAPPFMYQRGTAYSWGDVPTKS